MNTTFSFKKTIGAALLSGGVALAGLGFASATAHADAAPFGPLPQPNCPGCNGHSTEFNFTYGPLPEPRGGPKRGLPVEPLPECANGGCGQNMFGDGPLVAAF